MDCVSKAFFFFGKTLIYSDYDGADFLWPWYWIVAPV